MENVRATLESRDDTMRAEARSIAPRSTHFDEQLTRFDLVGTGRQTSEAVIELCACHRRDEINVAFRAVLSLYLHIFALRGMFFGHPTVAQLAGTGFPRCCSSPSCFVTYLRRAVQRAQRRHIDATLDKANLDAASRRCGSNRGLASVRSPNLGSQSERSGPIAFVGSLQKLDAAVAAMERVVSLKQNYQQQIAAAPPSEQERIAAEATNALAKAVTDQGLSVEEYDSILEVAQNDPQVGEKIRQRLPPSVK
jgi:hypothetical protein